METREITTNTLPDINIGSPKQTAWAIDIRKAFIEGHRLIVEAPEDTDAPAGPMAKLVKVADVDYHLDPMSGPEPGRRHLAYLKVAEMDQVLERLMASTDARTWIDLETKGAGHVIKRLGRRPR